MTVMIKSRPIFSSRENKTRLRFQNGRFEAIEADALDRDPPTRLFGLPLANATLRDAAHAIVMRAQADQRSIVHFINAHCINTLKADAYYGRALSHAVVLLPDGSGVRLAARLVGKKITDNLNGTDLFPLLCRDAARAGQSLYLLGGVPGLARKAGEAMQAVTPGLDIAGSGHGYFEESRDEEIVAEINASGARILLVGMGVPDQEKWIAKHRNRLTAPVILGVGGLFDYYSGRVARAPKAMRSMGLEWVWRLLQEPRRLANRYLIGNIIFIGHAIGHIRQVRGLDDQLARTTKRAVDVALSLAALMILSPILALLSVMIKAQDRGPIFFRQTRIGKDGKPFGIWKFRSMAVDAEHRLQALQDVSEREGACFKMKRDPRITPVGRWLRRLSLDELPQLINVMKGEMSIVGPRPALPSEVIAYDDRARGRLNGMPGLTCTWQVSGRAELPFENQVELDIAYLKRPSLLTDLKLILRTIPAVVSGRGAY